MANNNGYIRWLSPEIQTIVLQELNLLDLTALAKTRDENEEGVKYHVSKCQDKLFRSFVDNIDQWVNIMDRTGTVISGSTTLGLVQAKAGSVTSQDMDVYATQTFEKEILVHLKEGEGYNEVREVVRQPDYDGSAIKKIYKLEKEEKKIDVIVMHWTCTIAPILQFHTTSIMNYVTTCKLMCLYPCWTCDNKGFVNPCLYLEGKTNLSTVDGLMKYYVRQGFRISANPFCLADHECNEDIKNSAKTGYCPHKIRSTIDDEVL
ncbi:hypothetical protein F4604DRAFT_1685776 [Suillus subluteus]|nr:hypothetical protein F4604DRAFT_1685776 [Suillus subluteus]